jgi:hypothetical protein
VAGETEIDTTNRNLVGWQGTRSVVVLQPRVQMTPDEALVHAAWLVAIAEPNASHSFADVLEAVRNT